MSLPEGNLPRGATRRSFMAGMVGSASAFMLSGCLAGDAADDDQDSLNVWGAIPAESGPAALIKAFEKKYDQYKVRYTRYVNDPDGNAKLDSALQGGSNIDVYFTYRNNHLALRSRLCSDLTDLVAGDSHLAPLLDANDGRLYRRGKKVLAVATNREPYLIAANLAALSAANMDVPDSWTVEEFTAASRKLKDANGDMYGAYTIPDTARIALGPNYWYASNGRSNFSDPHFEQWLALGRELINDKTNYPWKRVLSQAVSSYQQSAFTKGVFAQWVIPPALLRYLHDPEHPHSFKVAALPLPKVSGSKSWNQGSYNNHIMIHPKSKRREAAEAFVKFWLTDGAKYMLSAGKIPIIGNYTEKQILEGILGNDADKNFDVNSFRKAIFAPGLKLSTDTEFAGYAEIARAVQKGRDSCWINESTPQQAVTSIRTAADAAIRKARN